MSGNISASWKESEALFRALKRAFGAENVVREFDSALGSADGFDRRSLYSPRPDYAIMPFNLRGDPQENNKRIGEAFSRNSRLISNIQAQSFDNGEANFDFNPNPRAFVVVEDEINSPTRKHRLGSIINASLLGKVGIVSGGPVTYASLCRIRNFLGWVGRRKGMYVGTNVMVIEKRKLISVLAAWGRSET